MTNILIISTQWVSFSSRSFAFNVVVEILAERAELCCFFQIEFQNLCEIILGIKSNVSFKSRKLLLLKIQKLTEACWLFTQIKTNTRTVLFNVI